MSDFEAQFKSKMDRAKDMKEEEKLYSYNGVLYPIVLAPEENLKALEGMDARTDDVMLVAYPKCGFNWMLAMLHKIMTAATGKKADPTVSLIEFAGPELLQAFHQAPSRRFLGTHLHPDNIPASFTTKKTKMLVVFRNPKDTVVSFYHFSNKNPVIPTPESWDGFFSKFMSGEVAFGSYFDHALAWEKRMDDPNVMIVTFEELKQDLSAGIRKVSEFFQLNISDAQVQVIAEESTFKALKDSSKDTHGQQLVNVIFRKGEVGDWKNHFSAAQSQEMDLAFEKHLAGTRLGAKLRYDLYCK